MTGGGGYVKIYLIDVDISHAQEEGVQSPGSPGAQELTRPSCPTEFIIIVIILTLFYSKNIYMVIMSSMSC